MKPPSKLHFSSHFTPLPAPLRRHSGRRQLQVAWRPRLLAVPAPASTTQELSKFSDAEIECKSSCAPEAAQDIELYFSTQALVADYQYALRYYRALKSQVGTWQSAFESAQGRHPNVEDAAQHGGPQFALLYNSFLEVRSRLLVELPRLRERMDEGPHRVGGSSSSSTQPGAVNANSSMAGGVNAGMMSPGGAPPSSVHSPSSSHHHHQDRHLHQQIQLVDSVSTWLRADRYRRQRGVAAVAAAATATTLDATLATVSANTAAALGCGVGPGPGQMPPPAASAGMEAVARAAPPLLTPPDVPHYHHHYHKQHQPVIWLTPLARGPLGTAGARQQQHLGANLTASLATAPSSSSSSSTGVLAAHPAVEPHAAEPRQVGEEQQQQSNSYGLSQQKLVPEAAAVNFGELQISGAATYPHSHSPGEDRQLFPAALQPSPPPPQLYSSPTSQAVVGHRSAIGGALTGGGLALVPAPGQGQGQGFAGEEDWRLAADVSLAADGRTKNALLAALQYKRTAQRSGAAAGSAVAAAGRGGSGGDDRDKGSTASGAEEGEGAELKYQGAGAVVVVVGEVQRGDASGVYGGRNRRADALPEAFMVCP